MSNETLEENILNTFTRAFPNMTENQKMNLLAYGEGMVAVLDKKSKKKNKVKKDD